MGSSLVALTDFTQANFATKTRLEVLLQILGDVAYCFRHIALHTISRRVTKLLYCIQGDDRFKQRPLWTTRWNAKDLSANDYKAAPILAHATYDLPKDLFIDFLQVRRRYREKQSRPDGDGFLGDAVGREPHPRARSIAPDLFAIKHPTFFERQTAQTVGSKVATLEVQVWRV